MSVMKGGYNQHEYLGGKASEYKGVAILRNRRDDSVIYRATIVHKHERYVKLFEKETEAAKWIDLKRIEFGKEPVNILKRA